MVPKSFDASSKALTADEVPLAMHKNPKPMRA